MDLAGFAFELFMLFSCSFMAFMTQVIGTRNCVLLYY